LTPDGCDPNVIRSMTGYGQAVRQGGNLRIQVDMKSVNHRFGEISIRLPREWLAFEDRLRRMIAGRIRRGRVEVYVQAERTGDVPAEAAIDWALAGAYRRAAEELKERFSLAGDLTVSDLLAVPGVVAAGGTLDAGEETASALAEAVGEALDQLCRMREAEGASLEADLRKRLAVLGGLAEEAARQAPLAVVQMRAKLTQRMRELLADAGVRLDESRLAMETALMAERSNIDEELTRIRSHLDQFADMLESADPIGRKLDFLIQELNREINTIGSKSAQTELSVLVVEMKAELEKMREQVQNIE
jgi:uncharacterized protein (TIGR00255 family)